MRKVQLNCQIPESWQSKLKQVARERSFEERKDISYLDLVREAILTVYNLEKDGKD